jgi:hypothetical protein
MSCLGTLEIKTTSPTNGEVYLFGRSNAGSQEITVWQQSNVFYHLGPGIYRWEVKKVSDRSIVKIGYITVENKNNCSNTVLNLEYGIYLHPIEVDNEQKAIPMPNLDPKYRFISMVVNNIEYENGAEYSIENGVLTWLSPFSLESTDKVRFKYLHFSNS